MRKLMLDLEELTVETFATTAPDGRGGTVLARGTTEYTDCWGMCQGQTAPVLYCTYNEACMNTIACDTSMSVCEGRSCQISCDSCNGTCAGATCVGVTCGAGETCVDHVCNYSFEPYCYG